MQPDPDPQFAPPPPLGFSSLRLMQTIAKPIMDDVSAEHDKLKSAQGPDLIIKKYESPEADRIKERTKSNKVANACLPCRTRKLKCDGLQPCGRCLHRQTECKFPEGVVPNQRKAVSNDDYNSLEDALVKLEALYTNLFLGEKGTEQARNALMELLQMIPESAFSPGSSASPSCFESTSSKQFVSPPPPNHSINFSFPPPPNQTSPPEPQTSSAVSSVNIDVIQSLSFARGQHFMGETTFYMQPAEAKEHNRSQANLEPPLPNINAQPPAISYQDQIHLIDVYYQHLHTYFPIMSKQLMYSHHYHLFKGQPSYLSPLLLYAIFAAAAPFSENARQFCRDPKELHTAGDQFLQYAIRIREAYVDAPRISTIIALVLLAVRLETSKSGQSTMKAWMLSGEAFRMSQDMGLHRNCESLGISPTDQQLRSRVFWAIFAFDRTLSMTHGRPLAFDEKDIDAPLPDMALEEDADMKETLRLFLQYVKLSKVSGRIIKHNYSPQSGMRASYKQDAMLSTLDSWLASVLMDLPDDLKYVPSNAVVQRDSNSPCVRPPFNQTPLSNDELPKTQFGKLLHLKLHTLLILLHRPYIVDNAGNPNQKPSQSKLIISRPSLDICTYAATIITHICNEMSAKDLSLVAKLSSGLYAMITAIRIHLMNALCNDPKQVGVGEANFERGLRLLRTISNETPGEMVLDTLYSLEQQYRSKGKQLMNTAKPSPRNTASPVTDSTMSTPIDAHQRMDSFSSPRETYRANGSPAKTNDVEETQFQFVPSRRDPATGNPKHTLPLKIIPYGPPGEASSKPSAGGSKERPGVGAPNGVHANGVTNGSSSVSPNTSVVYTPPTTNNGTYAHFNGSMTMTPGSNSIPSSITSTPYDAGESMNYSTMGFFPPLPDSSLAGNNGMMYAPHVTAYPEGDSMDVHMADIMMNDVHHMNMPGVYASRSDSAYLLGDFLHDENMNEESLMSSAPTSQAGKNPHM
ncbi:hypothetical protein INT43_005190 [Umbelopsis isabellina]|uniref:Zn(2)-C6 fungal-type domain-containing protein n=1 Tax=Mortierella isabellina TaxID=91625 RepID=A0A8H7PHH1_MORIS|nr:hypothetical protein INT43_005190 [Umbelopsis isabellina]